MGQSRIPSDPLDPRGLISEAYRMPGIEAVACRTIFFDWALGRSDAEGTAEAVRTLHARYAAQDPDHPMTAVLAEGMASAEAAGSRRTGRRRAR